MLGYNAISTQAVSVSVDPNAVPGRSPQAAFIVYLTTAAIQTGYTLDNPPASS